MRTSFGVAASWAAVCWLCPVACAAVPKPVAIVGSGGLGEGDLGLALDTPVKTLASQIELQLDDRYPGPGGYRIKRLADQSLIAFAAVDQAGLAQGARNWLRFVRPLGHWLLPPR
jgi:hypothetical protein